MLKDFSIRNFFILDESVPFIVKHAKAGQSEFAFRVSEFENYRNAINLQRTLKKINASFAWVWVDTFTGEVLSADATRQLQAEQLRCCFVSPELHRIDSPEKWKSLIEDFFLGFKEKGISPNMICTKEPVFWQSLYSQN